MKRDSDHTPAHGWSGRFSEPVAELVKLYTASVDFDQRLADADITASLAHARMLGATGVLVAADVDAIAKGLEQIRGEIERGEFAWSRDLEDVHFNIEKRLIALIGDAGKRLHTGRSRNDQVATDLRLYVRSAIDALAAGIVNLRHSLLDLAEVHAATVMPGFTHLQVAQPVTFGHHLLAYVEMLERDRGRLADCRRRANVSPLGSGALAGAGYPLDREATAAELGFDGVTANSLDAVSDRDFVVEALAAFALCMVHLSRLAEEITWWSNPRFGFVRAADSFSTGSSMMPNKKNPDPAELVRGRSARVIGSLTGMLALLKGLPLAYQRDLQEDKPPLFESAATLEASLGVMAGMVSTLTVDRERMRAAAGEGYTTATAVADAMVRRGVAFRAAHHIVGTLVAEAEKGGVGLDALDDATIAAALATSDNSVAVGLRDDAALPAELRAAAGLDGALAGCDVVGGTAPRRVAAALAAARARLGS